MDHIYFYEGVFANDLDFFNDLSL